MSGLVGFAVGSSLTHTRRENKTLTARIGVLVRKKQGVAYSLKSGNNSTESFRVDLKVLLEKLYTHICDFASYRGNAATPDEEILAAWESFLGPIKALTAVQPHGHMIAARMTLYLTQAYLHHRQLPENLPLSQSSAYPISLRCNFVVSLDDQLLSCLGQIWPQSNKREMFKWVFTEHPVDVCKCYFAGGLTCQDFAGPGISVKEYHEQRKRGQIKAACITDPKDLTPENGVQLRWRWERAEGDMSQHRPHPDCSRAGYQQSEDGESMLMWQDIGSDGPIRDSFRYTLVDQNNGEKVSRARAVLRRSRQFILDARKIADGNLARESERLAQVAMAKRSLPAELQLMVFEYLDEVREHPYLSKLDLSAAYEPFPDISKKCKRCTGRASSQADRMAKATCPLKSIAIWSLPLRAFHTLHQTSDGNWRLCPQIDCTGHHRDGSWQLQTLSVEEQLNSIIQDRCGQALTIRDIGLGPLAPAQLPFPASIENWPRLRQVFSKNLDDGESQDDQDDQEEARWVGMSGLANVMMHNEALVGFRSYFYGGNFWRNFERTANDHSWLVGRTRQDEFRACAGLVRHHGLCDFC